MSLAFPFLRCDFETDEAWRAGERPATESQARDIWIVREFRVSHPLTWGLFAVYAWPFAALMAERERRRGSFSVAMFRGAEAALAVTSLVGLHRFAHLLGSPRLGAWMTFVAFGLYGAASALEACGAARRFPTRG